MKIGKVTGDPSPRKDAQRPAPLRMDTVGGSTGIQSEGDTPPPQGCKAVSSPTQGCKALCSPLLPPPLPPAPPKKKPQSVGDPKNLIKPQGSPPPLLPPPQPPAHLRRLRGGAPGELRGAGGPGPVRGCGCRRAGSPAPLRSARTAHVPPRPAPPRAAPLSFSPLRAGGPGSAAPGAEGAPRSREVRGRRVPFSPSRWRPLFCWPRSGMISVGMISSCGRANDEPG